VTDPNWLVYPQSQYRVPDLNVLRSFIPTTDTVAVGTVANDDDDFPNGHACDWCTVHRTQLHSDTVGTGHSIDDLLPM